MERIVKCDYRGVRRPVQHNLKMSEVSLALLLLLGFTARGIAPTDCHYEYDSNATLAKNTTGNCYPDFCIRQEVIRPGTSDRCLLTPPKRGKDCLREEFENSKNIHADVKEPLGTFKLRAYRDTFEEIYHHTAFNLSVTDIKFHSLYTQYQRINSSYTVTRQIELSKKGEVPEELYVSCPFSDNTFEGDNFLLRYLAVGDNYNYTRTLIFKVPHWYNIADTSVVNHRVFTYVDITSLPSHLLLYVQRVPREFNVTRYKIWLCGTNKTTSLKDLVDDGNLLYVKIDKFPEGQARYHINVAAMHPTCGVYGCTNSSTPLIILGEPPARGLLIMIISIIWIPPVICYAMYQGYRMYKKKVRQKLAGRKPNCLLVYSPTHAAHVNVMVELAKYLRTCNINAMIDLLDIPETTNKDPGLWCDTAFRKADIVVVATSPPPSNVVVPTIYRNMDNHALRLLKENFSQRNKRYLAIQFPYCKSDNVAVEARNFKRLNMPEDLEKFVRTIYNIEYIRSFGISNKAFLDSVKAARVDILHEEPSKPKMIDETDDLLPPIMKQRVINLDQEKTSDTDMHEGNISSGFFATNIDELNLLGDSGEGEGESFSFTPQPSNTDFCIDRLNL